MTITDRQREKAFTMFANGVPSDKVASSLRLPVTSVRSLRAHWTMRNNASSNSTRTSGSVQTYTLTLSQAKRVADAYYDGIDNPTIRLSSSRISS